MATKNFTQFNTATPLTTSDYVVGYKADGTTELKTQVQSILNLKNETDYQTLSFNDANKNLTISSGNTVNLSSINTTFATNSGKYENIFTIVQTNSASWEESADIIPTVTNYLSTNNVLISSLTVTNGLTITGNISGNNLRTSFNLGSATGNYSFAEGSGKAFGDYSHAEGVNTIASGYASHAEGNFTVASGSHSHAEGNTTTASTLNSHAEGSGSTASGNTSHAEGFSTIASGTYSHAGGGFTVANGLNSYAIGRNSTAAQDYTYAWSDGNLGTVTQNISTTRSGQYMVSASGGMFVPGNLGIGTDNNTNALTILGNISGVNVRTSFNLGSATGSYSFAEGSGKAFGDYSHAEGQITVASGLASHAEGFQTTASADYSHAEGEQTHAEGEASHAEGGQTTASGDASHAEGSSTIASGSVSHAEGYNTRASGTASHAAGYRVTAAQDYTYAWSDGNLGTATANVSTTRSGQYMVSASGGMFVPGNVGIGTDNNTNALTVAGTISANQPMKFSSTATAPSNTSTPAAWMDVYVNDALYKLPLYQ